MWNWRKKNMNTDKATNDAADAASTQQPEVPPHQGGVGSDGGGEGPELMGDSEHGFGADTTALQAELEEAKSRILRLMADFQNYQRRALQNEQVARAEGVAKVASGVVTVIDHFDLALTQDPAKASVEQILSGVRVIREELVKVLAQYGVSLIVPAKNDVFMPGRHEAVMQQAAEGVEPGHVAAAFQAGYLLTTYNNERVLRPAKVAVAPQG